MKRLGILAGVLAVLLLVTAGIHASFEQAGERTIFVTALGGNGMPVIDPPLTAAELTVVEDGAERKVTKIAKADTPVYFAVLYETSLCDASSGPSGAGSAAQKQGACERDNNEANATQFVQQMREALGGFTSVILQAAPTSKILLMDFAGAAVVKQDFTSNIKDLEPITSKLITQKGEPVLNEAIVEISKRMAKVPAGSRKVVVVINREPTTEGSGGAQYKVVGEEARKSGASVWALSVRYGQRQNGSRDELLKALTANSGGLRLTIGNVMQLGDYLRSVAANSIVQYAVTFTRPADAPPTKITSVKTTREGVRPLTLQWSDK